MADGEGEGEEGEGEGEGEEGEKRLVDLRRSSLMASPQVKMDVWRHFSSLVVLLVVYESTYRAYISSKSATPDHIPTFGCISGETLKTFIVVTARFELQFARDRTTSAIQCTPPNP